MGKAYSSAAARAKAGVGAMPSDPLGVLGWIGQDPERARLAWQAVHAWPQHEQEDDDTQARDGLLRDIRELLPWLDLDEVRFTCYGNVTLLDLCELGTTASAETGAPEGIAAIAEFFKAALGEPEYRRFKTHTRLHGTGEDIILAIMQDLVEAFTARPTMPPSPSPAGQPITIPTSKVVSHSGQVTERPMTPEEFKAWWEQTQAPNFSAAAPATG